MDDIRKTSTTDNSLNEILVFIKRLWKFLLIKKIKIIIFGLIGASLGLTFSFFVKPRYTAYISFAMVEKSSPSGLASIASSFGFGGLFGGGDAFSGDNLLEIIKSRYTFEKTLLSPVVYEGSKKSLADVYIKINKLDQKWRESPNLELRKMNFPLDQDRNTFTRAQDSVLLSFYNTLVKPNSFSISRKDKKSNIVFLSFTSKNEFFSKSFSENLIDQMYEFYRQTRTAQSNANIALIQQTADSIKNLYENALFNSAGYSQANINVAIQRAVVPKIKEEYNAHLYGTVYAEVLKNLETMKLEKARETPIIQIIDKPILPLKMSKVGKVKGVVLGGVTGGLLIVLALSIIFYLTYKK